jgi:hypothetical protein
MEHLKRDVEAHDQVQKIEEASEKAASLTRQLLAFSRKQVLQPRVINLNSLVENLSSLLHRLGRVSWLVKRRSYESRPICVSSPWSALKGHSQAFLRQRREPVDQRMSIHTCAPFPDRDLSIIAET